MNTGQRFVAYLAVLGTLVCQAEPTREEEPGKELRDFAVRTWTKENGLPDTSVSVILQTSDGYLWIGTGAGLARFDGLRFVNLPLPREGTNAPVAVTALCEDNRGGLWIGTQEQGIYRRKHGQLRRFGVSDGLLDWAITSLTSDNDGQVWIGTRRGVNRWNGRSLDAFTTRDGLPDNSVLSVHAARSGTVWITTVGGMCRFMDGHLSRFHFPTAGPERDEEFLEVYEDRRGNLWGFCATYLINLAQGKRINYFPGEESAVTRIWSLCEGQGGRLWIGASGRGVFCFDGARYQPVTLNEGRWPNDVRTICEDHEGDLWLGISDVGLVQLRPQSFALLTENLGLPPGTATCLMTNSLGRLFVGMDSGGLYASSGDRFVEVKDETKFLSQDLAVSMCPGAGGSLWVGTAGTGLYQVNNGKSVVYTTANGLSDDCVLAACSDGSGTVWAGTRSGGLHRIADGQVRTFGASDGLPGTAITAVLPTPANGLWVGTANGMLLRSEEEFRGFKAVRMPTKMGGKAILALCPRAEHGLWIGTDGGGMGYLEEELCRAWNSQNGLTEDIASGITEDGGGNLWLVGPRGLGRIGHESIEQALASSAPLKEKLILETRTGPTRGWSYGGPRALASAEGRLWFALGSGLTGIDIHGSERDKPAPQVHIEATLVNNEAVVVPAPDLATEGGAGKSPAITLPARLRTLELQFTASSFEAPGKVRFRHKLDGFDSDWVDSGPERHARYGPLPSGHYKFHVTACNAEGVWNEQGASLALVVPTPVWREAWVLALGGLLTTTIGAGTVRLVSHRRLRRRLAGLEQQQAMERERMRIARNMHDEIGSKLTKVSFLSERVKVEMRGTGKVEAKIDAIATTSRELLKTLDEMVWAVNPRNDTLEHLAAYLCEYAREYFQNTPIECDLHVQSKLPQVEMSAETRHNLFLAVEEGLNNVLKHSRATVLRLDISAVEDELLITIRDNGLGFAVKSETVAEAGAKPGSGAGDGLQNMCQRLKDTGGECSIQSAPAQGTCVSLSMPLNGARLRGR
ncbi:Histidine kinase [Verrucomicrobia bacterium]|nr:Histidine kinase [Verrucomicrobiota bacterium]